MISLEVPISEFAMRAVIDEELEELEKVNF
jgi:hypothetical protein